VAKALVSTYSAVCWVVVDAAATRAAATLQSPILRAVVNWLLVVTMVATRAASFLADQAADAKLLATLAVPLLQAADASHPAVLKYLAANHARNLCKIFSSELSAAFQS